MEKDIEKVSEQGFSQKLSRLEEIISGLGPMLVALSGGVDSAVLLNVACRVSPDKVVAATARSILVPPDEVETAEKIAKSLGAHHIIFEFDALSLERVRNNSIQRCYYCKMSLGQRLWSLARELDLTTVAEGSQTDDAQGHRPGAKALRELGIRSPLLEAGFNKENVRHLAHKMNLANWNRPSGACLATRFPYGSPLTSQALEQVCQAERLLIDEGLTGGRARHHGDIVRLELPSEALKMLGDVELRSRLNKGLTRLGFSFITVDLAGYRSGSFDGPPTEESRS